MTVSAAAPNVDNSSALVGVGVVVVVTVAIIAALAWAFFRLRSTQPVLTKGVSDIRAETFAAQTLREFRPVNRPDVNGGAAGISRPTAGPATPEHFGSGASLTVNPAAPAALTPAAVPGPGSGPQLVGSFTESIRELVDGIKFLALDVEQAAVEGGGSDSDRAARVVGVFVAGLATLPLAVVVTNAARTVPPVSNQNEVGTATASEPDPDAPGRP